MCADQDVDLALGVVREITIVVDLVNYAIDHVPYDRFTINVIVARKPSLKDRLAALDQRGAQAALPDHRAYRA